MYILYIVCISLSLYIIHAITAYVMCMCIMWSTLTAAQYLECSKECP